MHAALFYPRLVPSDDWIKQSLLLFDAVASVAPPGYEPKDPLLEFLHREHLWQPLAVGEVVEDIATYEAEVMRALAVFAHNGAERPHRIPIYVGKFGWAVEHRLRELGLATSDRVDPRFLLVADDVADVVLGITARRLAADSVLNPNRYVVSTTSEAAFRRAFAPLDARDRLACMSLLMNGMLPVPDPSVSIEEIVDFRLRHGDEVAAVRVALSELASEVAQGERPETAALDAIEALRASREALRAAARRRSLVLRGGSVALLVGGAVMAAEGAFEPGLEWAFQGAGLAVATEMIRYFASPGSSRNAFSYLHKAEIEFG